MLDTIAKSRQRGIQAGSEWFTTQHAANGWNIPEWVTMTALQSCGIFMPS